MRRASSTSCPDGTWSRRSRRRRYGSTPPDHAAGEARNTEKRNTSAMAVSPTKRAACGAPPRRPSARSPQPREPDVTDRRGAGLARRHDDDLVSGPDVAGLQDSQVRAEARRLLELLHEPRVTHPDAELEAREPGLGDLEL